MSCVQKILKINLEKIMILKKIIIGLIYICFLNGCVQSTTLLGPAYTLVSTGSIYQAGLSYGSEEAIKKATGKSTTENIKRIFDQEEIIKEEIIVKEEENYDDFFALVKTRVNKTHKIINSTNQ